MLATPQPNPRPDANRDDAAPRHGHPRARRIRRSADFERALRGGVRVVDAVMTLWGCDNDHDLTRFGLIVGRRHGNAVRRNRIKRLLREAFRLTRPTLPPGLDLVCAPRVGTRLTLAVCQQSLRRNAERIQRKLAS